MLQITSPMEITVHRCLSHPDQVLGKLPTTNDPPLPPTPTTPPRATHTHTFFVSVLSFSFIDVGFFAVFCCFCVQGYLQRVLPWGQKQTRRDWERWKLKSSLITPTLVTSVDRERPGHSLYPPLPSPPPVPLETGSVKVKRDIVRPMNLLQDILDINFESSAVQAIVELYAKKTTNDLSKTHTHTHIHTHTHTHTHSSLFFCLPVCLTSRSPHAH